MRSRRRDQTGQIFVQLHLNLLLLLLACTSVLLVAGVEYVLHVGKVVVFVLLLLLMLLLLLVIKHEQIVFVFDLLLKKHSL